MLQISMIDVKSVCTVFVVKNILILKFKIQLEEKLLPYLDVTRLLHEPSGILCSSVSFRELDPEELESPLKVCLQEVLFGRLEERGGRGGGGRDGQTSFIKSQTQLADFLHSQRQIQGCVDLCEKSLILFSYSH